MTIDAQVVIGALLALVSTLILLNLRSIKSCVRSLATRIDKQDTRLDTFDRGMKDCKLDCDRNTVSKEDWVRSEGYMRTELKAVSQTLSRMEGRMGVTDKLPQICGAIAAETAKEIVTELRRGGTVDG